VAEQLLDWVAGLPTAAVYVVLAVLSCVENVFPPVPADVAVVFGAFLSRRGITSAPLLGAVCWLANTASSAGMYFLARARGKQFFASGWPRKLMPPSSITALQRLYRKHGMVGIFLSRFLPGLRAAVTPFAGVVGLTPAQALIPSAVASAIWYAFLVAVGAALGRNWDAALELLSSTNRVLGMVGLATAVLVAIWLWRRRRDDDD
jgi:membrane protein DedA with SNARE-associated domain